MAGSGGFVLRCSKHFNVEYFPEHFSECKQTLEKQIFSCKSFAFANILRQKIFYVETNGAFNTNDLQTARNIFDSCCSLVDYLKMT